MKNGLKVLLGFAAGAAAGYFAAKNSDKFVAAFDEVCYKIDDLRDQLEDFRSRHECYCEDDCDECPCADDCTECDCENCVDFGGNDPEVVVEDITDEVREIVEDAADAAENVGDKASDIVSTIVEDAEEAVEEIAEAAEDAGKEIVEAAEDAGNLNF